MSEINPFENLKAKARAQAAADEPARVRLLDRLAVEAFNQLSALDGVRLRDTRELQLLLVAQSLNAMLCSLDLLRDGYPRMALALARLLREGSIAFRWTSVEENQEAVENSMNAFLSGSAWPTGKWPRIREMGARLPSSFEGSVGFQDLHRRYRETHNELFSHAVSDWSLQAAAGTSDAGEWRLAVGPVYDRHLFAQAADHLMPLFMWTLVDAGEFVAAIRGAPTRKQEVDVLIRATQAWIRGHPPPVSQDDLESGAGQPD